MGLLYNWILLQLLTLCIRLELFGIEIGPWLDNTFWAEVWRDW